jgi:hypothetical protein
MDKPKLTKEEKEAGVEIIEQQEDDNEIESIDVSDKKIEQMARGYIMGSQAIGRKREIKDVLEEKVTKRIGRKGKYLTDKLFELIDGVYTVQKQNGKEIKYYKVPPSLNAITYALDRVLGKPVARSAKDNQEKKGVMIVESIIRNLAGGGTIEKKKSIEIRK